MSPRRFDWPSQNSAPEVWSPTYRPFLFYVTRALPPPLKHPPFPPEKDASDLLATELPFSTRTLSIPFFRFFLFFFWFVVWSFFFSVFSLFLRCEGLLCAFPFIRFSFPPPFVARFYFLSVPDVDRDELSAGPIVPFLVPDRFNTLPLPPHSFRISASHNIVPPSSVFFET